MSSLSVAEKPHVVCLPYPAQGHINPMLKLAKLLHHKGFHVTFVHTEYNHKRLLKSRGPTSLDGLPGFRFETIPDGLPPTDDVDATQDIPSLCYSTSNNCLVPFRNLLAKLNNDTSSSDVPPVTCIVSDGIMSFSLEAAEELGVPYALFWTTSACGFLAYTQYSSLIDRGLTPLKGAVLCFPTSTSRFLPVVVTNKGKEDESQVRLWITRKNVVAFILNGKDMDYPPLGSRGMSLFIDAVFKNRRGVI